MKPGVLYECAHNIWKDESFDFLSSETFAQCLVHFKIQCVSVGARNMSSVSKNLQMEGGDLSKLAAFILSWSVDIMRTLFFNTNKLMFL